LITPHRLQQDGRVDCVIRILEEKCVPRYRFESQIQALAMMIPDAASCRFTCPTPSSGAGTL